MTNEVRVRYAPSPTGYPHLGNIRTAMFNWLFARHNGGKFIVRIEDTDRERYVEGAVESILESLNWLGLDWDEGPDKGGDYGPYYQSERLPLYRKAAEKLVAEGKAYYCHCSSEKLDKMREDQIARKEPPGYDRCCRDRGLGQKEGAVIRFKIPLDGQTAFTDLIRGEVTFDNAKQDDFVILKSDGFPTYHLASVVDDHAMQISHVLRAEEWLPSTPKHLMLYKALGYTPPLYAHLPMILGPDRSKLSKRHGATSTIEYKQAGYLPETMVNFLSLLGWAYDDKTELFSREQLIEYFCLEKVSKTAAIFNYEKLDWMNGMYIRTLSAQDLACRAMPFLEKDVRIAASGHLNLDYTVKVMPLIQERAKKLNELAELCWFIYSDDISYDPALLIDKKLTKETSLSALKAANAHLEALPNFDAASMEEHIRPLAAELELKPGQLFGMLRTASTGQQVAPPLFQTMEVLGRQRCLGRIAMAIARLSEMPFQRS
ncbi:MULTISPECIES: glutamate--tRNA ligase [Dehalococcoides]|uniref:glutamate--tRNA ligase n=1 Tax=Dehalococcoides TaxID=61434 RepID=UPI0002B75F79|nr:MULTISPECIES: glutamate--tRNA ligase [Dehalococcoides]AGG06823.1 glutamate--tRNA ligase [Dehalococcoides mccartyi DCMB5]